MGDVVRLSALFGGRARSNVETLPPRKPRLPTHHLPALVPPPVPELLIDLDRLVPAASDWQGAPVLVMESCWYGRVLGWDPLLRRLVVRHIYAGQALHRHYHATELRRLREGDPRA